MGLKGDRIYVHTQPVRARVDSICEYHVCSGFKGFLSTSDLWCLFERKDIVDGIVFNDKTNYSIVNIMGYVPLDSYVIKLILNVCEELAPNTFSLRFTELPISEYLKQKMFRKPIRLINCNVEMFIARDGDNIEVVSCYPFYAICGGFHPFESKVFESLDLSEVHFEYMHCMSLLNGCSCKTVLMPKKFGALDEFSLVCDESFMNCRISKLDISGLDVTNIEGFAKMFNGSSIGTLLMPKTFKPKRKFSAECMFNAFSTNADLDFSSWDTRMCTDMQCMFADTITGELNLSSFRTGNVKCMDYMFYGVNSSLVDISNFSSESLVSASNMFDRAKIETLNLGSFYPASNTSFVSDSVKIKSILCDDDNISKYQRAGLGVSN